MQITILIIALALYVVGSSDAYNRLEKRIKKLEAFQQQTIGKEINEIGNAFSREGLGELWK